MDNTFKPNQILMPSGNGWEKVESSPQCITTLGKKHSKTIPNKGIQREQEVHQFAIKAECLL